MIVDSSVLVAIALNEEDQSYYRAKLEAATHLAMSAASFAEASIAILRRKSYAESIDIESLILAFNIDVVPFTESQAILALAAYARFGKGHGHPAQLNFGDCMMYALAKESGEALLFKGEDFSQTDLYFA